MSIHIFTIPTCTIDFKINVNTNNQINKTQFMSNTATRTVDYVVFLLISISMYLYMTTYYMGGCIYQFRD